MSDTNVVVVVGRLTRDPEVRYTSGGMPIVTLGLAVNGREKDAAGNWGEKPNFFDITLFGERFEKLALHMAKGKRLGVTGRLEYQSWEKDGVKRSKVIIVGNDVQLLDGAAQGEQPAQSVSMTPAAFANTDFAPIRASQQLADDDVPF